MQCVWVGGLVEIQAEVESALKGFLVKARFGAGRIVHLGRECLAFCDTFCGPSSEQLGGEKAGLDGGLEFVFFFTDLASGAFHGAYVERDMSDE